VSRPVELHQRTLSVETHPLGGEMLHVHASAFGTSHPAGVVHHMALDVEIDRGLTVRGVHAWMGNIPFERSARTGGEGCRDILPNYQRLVGTKFDEGYPLRILGTVGGPHGCFHVLSLAQCLPLAVRAASRRLCGAALRMPADSRGEVLDSCSEWRAGGPNWNQVCEQEGTGFSDFRRQMRVRARADDQGRFRLIADLVDDGAGLAPMSASLALRLETPSLRIDEAAAELGGMPFPGCSAPLRRVAGLEGLSIAKGFTGAALERIGGAAGCAHLAALVIALAPVVPQAFRAFAAVHPPTGVSPARGEATNSRADSCHMWRLGGPLMSLDEARPAARRPRQARGEIPLDSRDPTQKV
jgi:hypothetical protein